MGTIGHLTDILCTVGTLFGVATSLGLGAMQINAGISAYMDVPISTSAQIWIIGLITIAATISVVSGIDRGIRLLSEFNILLGGAVLLFVFAAGPSLFQLKLLTNTLGSYLSGIVDMSLWVDLREGVKWQKSWTIFYWGWWISWSPFVGIFIARISKGRTIREFVLNVFLAPSAVTFLWLAVFGGTGLHMEIFGGGGISKAIDENVALSLNAVFSNLPLAVMPAVGTLLVITFFITSSDSGSLVDDMVTSGGHPDPPTAQRVFWAFSEGGPLPECCFTRADYPPCRPLRLRQVFR